MREARRAAEAKRSLITMPPSVDPGSRRRELEVWNDVFAQKAEIWQKRRLQHIEQLQEGLREIAPRVGIEVPELHYRPSPGPLCADPQQLRERLEERLDDEIRAGRLLLGPQRDELEILWRGRPTRRRISAGETKILGLCLLAAQSDLVHRESPAATILLDDFDAELDDRRLAAAWRLFESSPQVVVTSTRRSPWKEIRFSQRWFCEGGRIVEE